MKLVVKIIQRGRTHGASRAAPIAFALCRTTSERNADFPRAAAA
jgi:hypothetical protein